MPEHFKTHLIISLVVALFVLPLGLFLLRRGARTRMKKILSIFGTLLLGLVCSAILILFLLHYGVLEMEWRGGYVPVLTLNKTKPDFDALAKSRAQQSKPSTVPA